jgi:hypothetical protein
MTNKKEQHKKYYEANKEKLREYDKQRYVNYREIKAKKDHERYIKNKEDYDLVKKENERVKLYREKNKEEISRKAKEKRAFKTAMSQNKTEEDLREIEEKKILKKEESRLRTLQYKKEYREKNKELLSQKQKEYSCRESGKIVKRESSWRKNGINITYDKYLEISSLQNFQCAVCGVHQDNLEKSLCVDHDHNNGKIRGLLCSNCNIAIGFLKEDENLLLSAISYLKKYK